MFVDADSSSYAEAAGGGAVRIQTMEELLSRAEMMAGAEPVELPHVLSALSGAVAERALSPEQDAAYYKFCVKLASEPSARTYLGHPAGSWLERLVSVNERHQRRLAAPEQRQRHLARLALSGWKQAVRESGSPVSTSPATRPSPTMELPAGLIAPDISRISPPAASHGFWTDKKDPESRWSLTEAGDQPLTHTSVGGAVGSSHAGDRPSPGLHAPAREELLSAAAAAADTMYASPGARTGGEGEGGAAGGDFVISPPRPDWAAMLLCGCFRKWAILTDEARHLRMEYSHAVAVFEEEAERWSGYVLTRAFRVWRLCMRMQIAASYADDTVFRYCWRRWTLLVRISLAELHREDVLLCSCLRAFRQVCIAIAHQQRYQARATLLRLSLAAEIGQQKQLAVAYWGQHALDMPWKRWVEYATESARSRQCIEIADGLVAQWTPLKMAGWFGRWSTCSTAKLQSKRRSEMAMVHVRQAQLDVCVGHWFRYTQVRHHKLRRVAQVLIYVSNRLLATSMHQWVYRAGLTHKVRQVTARFMYQLMARAWAGFVERGAVLIAKRIKMVNALMHFDNVVMRLALGTWIAKWKGARTVDKKLQVALAKMCNQKLGAAFGSWAESIGEINDNRNKLERIISLFLNRTLHAAFRGWTASTEQKRTDRERMLKVVKMFQNLRLSRVFHGWLSRIDQKIEDREKMIRAAKRMLNLRLSAAFVGWKTRTAFKVDCNEKVGRAVRLMLNAMINAAFSGWYDNISEKVSNREKMSKITKMTSSTLISSAFNAWYGNTIEKLDMQKKAEKIVRMFCNRQLSAAWGGWLLFVDSRIENRDKVRRALGHIQNGALITTFDRWVQYTDTVSHAREQMYATVLRCDSAVCVGRVVSSWRRATKRLIKRRRKREKERVEEASLDNAVQHWLGVTKEKAFISWVANAQSQLEAREMMTKVLQFFTHKTLAASFNGWIDAITESMENRDKLEKLIFLIFKRVLRAAFMGWKYNAAEKSQNRERMMQAVKIFQLGNISSAFNQWYDRVNKVLEDRELIKAALIAMGKQLLVLAFNEWANYGVEQLELLRIMTAAAKLIMNFRISAAFRGWYARMIEKIEMKEKLGIAVQHMFNQDLSGAFNSWVANAMQSAESRRIMLTVIKTFTKAGLAAAVSRCREFAIEKVEMRELLGRTLKLMSNATLGSIFRWWKESMVGDQALRYLLNRSVGRAFASWAAALDAAAEKHVRMERSLQFFSNRTSSSAFNGWADAVDVAKGYRDALVSILQRFRNRNLLSAFMGWQAAVGAILDRQERLTGAIAHWHNRALTAALRSWQDLAAERAVLKEKLQHAVAMLGGSRLIAGFHGWSDTVQHRLDNRERINGAIAHWRNRALGAAFTTWSNYGMERIALRTKLHTVLFRLSTLAVVAAFTAWSTISQRSLQVHGFVHEMTAKWQQGVSRRTFEAWFVWAARRTELAVLQHAVTAAQQQRAKAHLVRSWNLLFVACCTYRLFMARLALRTWIAWVTAARHTRVLQKVVTRLAMRTIIRCFQAWRSVNSALISRQQKMQKTLAKMNNRFVSQSFIAWAEQAAEAAEFTAWATLRVESMAKKMLGDALYTALVTWHEWTLRRERARLVAGGIVTSRAQRARGERMKQWRQRYVQSKTIRRIRRQGVSAAWNYWLEFVQNAKTRQGKIKAAAKRWRGSTMAGKFHHWQNTVYEAERMRVGARKLRTRQWWLRWVRLLQEVVLTRLKAALNRMSQHCTGTALRKWIEFSRGRIRQRTVVAAAVKRIQQRELQAIFNRWYTAMHKRSTDNDTVAKVVNRLRLRVATSAFHTWASLASHSAHEKTIVIRHWRETSLRAASGVFMHWRAETQHSLELRSLLRLWLGRRVASMLSQYVFLWHDTMLVNDHRRWAADQIAVATCARLAKRTWVAWKLAHKSDVHQQRLNGRHARAVLHQWFSASQRSAEQRWRLQAITARRVHRKHGLLLSAWRYYAVYSQRSRQVVGASRLRRHRVQAAYCLNLWRHTVAYAVELRHALRLWLGRKVAVMLTASFRQWLEFCTKQAATELSWVRAVDFASARISHALDQCFFALRRNALAQAEKRQLYAIAEDCCSHHRLRACFEGWRGHLAEVAMAARQSSLTMAADSSLGDYLEASFAPVTYHHQYQQQFAVPALHQQQSHPSPEEQSRGFNIMGNEAHSSPVPAANPSLWQSQSLNQLGKDLEALASSFAMVGRPATVASGAQ